METRSIVVTGMSCGHCANAIRAEIGKLPGVAEVDVDVAAGQVRKTRPVRVSGPGRGRVPPRRWV